MGTTSRDSFEPSQDSVSGNPLIDRHRNDPLLQTRSGGAPRRSVPPPGGTQTTPPAPTPEQELTTIANRIWRETHNADGSLVQNHRFSSYFTNHRDITTQAQFRDAFANAYRDRDVSAPLDFGNMASSIFTNNFSIIPPSFNVGGMFSGIQSAFMSALNAFAMRVPAVADTVGQVTTWMRGQAGHMGDQAMDWARSEGSPDWLRGLVPVADPARRQGPPPDITASRDIARTQRQVTNLGTTFGVNANDMFELMRPVIQAEINVSRQPAPPPEGTPPPRHSMIPIEVPNRIPGGPGGRGLGA